jgi:hypothetical protein
MFSFLTSLAVPSFLDTYIYKLHWTWFEDKKLWIISVISWLTFYCYWIISVFFRARGSEIRNLLTSGVHHQYEINAGNWNYNSRLFVLCTERTKRETEMTRVMVGTPTLADRAQDTNRIDHIKLLIIIIVFISKVYHTQGPI